MSAATPLVEALDLHRDYGSLRAVAGVDLRLERGRVLGLLGPNGAGKTSTLQMVCGVLAPTTGRICIDGIDLLDEPRLAKRMLGYLPERPPLYRDMTVTEYLDFCAALHGIRRAHRTGFRRRALERCALDDVQRRLIGNLSKGYQQRVGIAQALLHEPPAIVLDEPTVGLDPIQIREIRALIAELGREHGIILSTHILAEVQAVCSHVQIMHRGRTVHRDALSPPASDSSPERVVLRLRRTVDADDLLGLDGVREVEPLGDDRWQLRLRTGGSIDALAEVLVERGWGLLELVPERRSLEQIFIEATTRDATFMEAEDAA